MVVLSSIWSSLLIEILVDGIGCLGLIRVQKATKPREGLIVDTENGGNRSLSVGNKAYLLVLLILGVINLKNVVSTLQGFVV